MCPMPELRQLRRKTEIRRFQEGSPLGDTELVVWLQDWSDPFNVGGMFRVADAAGVTQLILSGKTPQPPDDGIAKTSMGSHRRVPWRHVLRNDEAAAMLREAGYTLVAVEVAAGAVPFGEFQYPAKTCLVLGNEGVGVYANVMKLCDAAVFIPMAGKGRSLNVHVAAAIVCFEAKLRA